MSKIVQDTFIENDLVITFLHRQEKGNSLCKANDFGNEFDQLTVEAKAAMDATIPLAKVTDDSLKATQDLRDFKAQGTEGILSCKIKSIIIPLLGDHVLREANHYLRLLKMFERK